LVGWLVVVGVVVMILLLLLVVVVVETLYFIQIELNKLERTGLEYRRTECNKIKQNKLEKEYRRWNGE
jgi:hypothetical protein